MAWYDGVADSNFDVDCEGQRHTICWSNGEVVLTHHPDVQAEKTLVALGGRKPRCLEIFELWELAVSDGGFIEEWAPFERLREEADALGFYLSSHPLDAYGSLIEDLGVTSYNSLNEEGSVSENGNRKKITAVVQKRRERNSRRGRYAFLEVSDQTATFEVTVFSELLSRKRELLETGTALLMEVSVQKDTDSLRLIAQKIDLYANN